MNMIQLNNLERSYKTPAGQTWVLRRINLEIREGEFITIMGPSGAGKSSLLNVLALLDDVWEGEYWFREEAVHAMKRKQRSELAKRNIGMVFQLLLADEPTGNLHSSQAKEIMELFQELNQQGTTIIQVTHSDTNAAYGSRTIQLRDGWMVSDTANPEFQPYEAVKQ